MEIFDLAKKLGQALKEDQRLVALEAAKVAYEGDTALQKSMIEYDVQQKAMQREVAKPDRDLQFIETIQNRIDKLYTDITENPVFLKLNEAQAEVNDLMNQVNQAITCAITGEDPSAACTHNCSTCHSHCH